MIESLWILILVGINSSILGNLLVQKQAVMVADAISHTILLGIVIGYVCVRNLDSPLLIIGATLFGVLTVYAIELLANHTNIQQDAAIGIVFTFFFALAVIIISKYFDAVHLDIDMVLLGEIIFAPLNKMTLFNWHIPVGYVQNSIVLLVILAFLLRYYASIKLMLFDTTFAQTINVKVRLIQLIMMTLVALHCVVAFQSVGAILVISMMVTPAMFAQLFSKSFLQLLLIGIAFSIINATIGFMVSIQLNVSMSGMIASIGFAIFIISFILKKYLLKFL